MFQFTLNHNNSVQHRRKTCQELREVFVDLTHSRKMAVLKITLAVLLISMAVQAQRPFYAGLRAIGYPEVETNLLTNRFSEREDYPIEARGDRGLVNRLSALPQDNQPFWFLNYRQYRDMMRNPQSYPQRPNIFSNQI